MFDYIKKVIPICGAILFTAICNNSAEAQTEPSEIIDRIEQYTNEGKQDIEQVTNVNQLRDVSPTDWSYDALRSLTDRYGCISGFPDGTFKGDRPMTRNEFAAGLNSCFEQIERSLSFQKPTSSNWFLYEKRFIEEDGSITSINDAGFMPEEDLATLGGRIDELESRTV